VRAPLSLQSSAGARGTAVLLLLSLMVWPWASIAAAQEGTNRAALVVRYEDGSIETKCVSFSEPEISGEELFQRSGLTVVMDYNALSGGAVCSIKGIGCSVQDCFCRCQGSDCQYWAYYHWGDGGWQYSQLGASGYQVKNGALEGWSWGPGNFSSGTEPPAARFEEICARGAVTSAATNPIPAAPSSWLGYASFAVAALLLVGAGVLVTRRRRP
jgi:hypothetical protein